MELCICHLYPELLNLYGDVGNVKILEYRAKERGIEVFVHTPSVGDTFEKDRYDIVVLGGGQAFEMGVIANDLSGEKKEALNAYIEDGGVMLATGDGYELLGTHYEKKTGERINGLGILPIYTREGEKRFTGNIAIEVHGTKVVGFENHAGRTYIGDLEPLGKVVSGFGNNGEDKTEGVIYKGTYGTYLHGPLLSKNPSLADAILEAALKKRYGDCTLAPLDDSLEIAAQNAMLAKLGIEA